MEVEREICRALVQLHSEGEGAKEVCCQLPRWLYLRVWNSEAVAFWGE